MPLLFFSVQRRVNQLPEPIVNLRITEPRFPLTGFNIILVKKGSKRLICCAYRFIMQKK